MLYWIRVCNDLYTFIKPLQFKHTYYLPVVNSHGCMITSLVVCCISVVSSWFSVMSCSEITRFHAQLKPVQNYTFLKDPRPFTSSNFREQSMGSVVRGSLELLRIRVRKQTHLQSVHL